MGATVSFSDNIHKLFQDYPCDGHEEGFRLRNLIAILELNAVRF